MKKLVHSGSTTLCRVCMAPDCLLTSISKATRVCAICIRAKEITSSDGSMQRFCYGHRRMEPLREFKGEQTRSVATLSPRL